MFRSFCSGVFLVEGSVKMEDNNDLKIEIKKIGKLEGGKFQNMCNQILDEMGYRIHPLGSHDESDKTTPGTPDTFF